MFQLQQTKQINSTFTTSLSNKTQTETQGVNNIVSQKESERMLVSGSDDNPTLACAAKEHAHTHPFQNLHSHTDQSKETTSIAWLLNANLRDFYPTAEQQQWLPCPSLFGLQMRPIFIITSWAPSFPLPRDKKLLQAHLQCQHIWLHKLKLYHARTALNTYTTRPFGISDVKTS